jgi:hypothetical protein
MYLGLVLTVLDNFSFSLFSFSLSVSQYYSKEFMSSPEIASKFDRSATDHLMPKANESNFLLFFKNIAPTIYVFFFMFHSGLIKCFFFVCLQEETFLFSGFQILVNLTKHLPPLKPNINKTGFYIFTV